MIIEISLFTAVGASVLWILHRTFFRHLTAPDTINPLIIISRIAFRHKSSVIEHLRRFETKFSIPDHMRVIANSPEGMTDSFYQLTILFALGTVVVFLIVIGGATAEYLSARPSQKASIACFYPFFLAFMLCLYLAFWCWAGARHREGLERAYAETSGLPGVADRPPIE